MLIDFGENPLVNALPARQNISLRFCLLPARTGVMDVITAERRRQRRLRK
jgi:hypothetical protein